jgi:hypothetical protein
MSKVLPFSGNNMYKTSAANDLIADLRNKKHFKCEIQVVSSQYLFGFAGHSLVKLSNEDDKKVYYMHICDSMLSHPSIINGENEFQRYLGENNKKSLGTIPIRNPIYFHDKLANALSKYCDGKVVSWGGAYHNCHSFARSIVKQSVLEHDLSVTPAFVPRIPTMALKRVR